MCFLIYTFFFRWAMWPIGLLLTSWHLPSSLTYFLQNFNFVNHFWTVSSRALIFYMRIPWDKTFSLGTNIFDPVTLTFEFRLLFENYSMKDIGLLGCSHCWFLHSGNKDSSVCTMSSQPTRNPVPKGPSFRAGQSSVTLYLFHFNLFLCLTLRYCISS